MSTTTPHDQPQPARGPDEDVEPRARKMQNILCAGCKQGIWWDGGSALWCDNRECAHVNRVYWNADLKLNLTTA